MSDVLPARAGNLQKFTVQMCRNPGVQLVRQAIPARRNASVSVEVKT